MSTTTNTQVGEKELEIFGETLHFRPDHNFIANFDDDLEGGVFEAALAFANHKPKFSHVYLGLYHAHRSSPRSTPKTKEWFKQAVFMDGGLNKWGEVVLEFIAPIFSGLGEKKSTEGQTEEAQQNLESPATSDSP